MAGCPARVSARHAQPAVGGHEVQSRLRVARVQRHVESAGGKRTDDGGNDTPGPAHRDADVVSRAHARRGEIATHCLRRPGKIPVAYPLGPVGKRGGFRVLVGRPEKSVQQSGKSARKIIRRRLAAHWQQCRRPVGPAPVAFNRDAGPGVPGWGDTTNQRRNCTFPVMWHPDGRNRV